MFSPHFLLSSLSSPKAEGLTKSETFCCSLNAGKITKGIQRWRELPEPADFASERGLNPPRSESVKQDVRDQSNGAKLVDNAPLLRLVQQWRSKWKLGLFAPVRDMTSLGSSRKKTKALLKWWPCANTALVS